MSVEAEVKGMVIKGICNESSGWRNDEVAVTSAPSGVLILKRTEIFGDLMTQGVRGSACFCTQRAKARVRRRGGEVDRERYVWCSSNLSICVGGVALSFGSFAVATTIAFGDAPRSL